MKFEPFEPDARRDRLTGLRIRAATKEDLTELAILRRAREGGDAAEHRAIMGRKLADDFLLVAERAGTVIGYASAGTLDPAGAPSGFYLTGVVVAEEWRRRGVASELTRARLAWIAERTDEAFYVANERNRVSIALHEAFGFEELTREFAIPGVTFDGGAGVLFRIALRPESGRAG